MFAAFSIYFAQAAHLWQDLTLCMRKRNTNTAVPLDAVPERRAKRCSPSFRPGDHLCELSFRYQFPGSEGEKCRPLDHK